MSQKSHSQNSVKINIIKTLITEDRKMHLSEISRFIEQSPQLTKYHIDALLEEGVLIDEREKRVKEVYYRLQSFYYLEEPINAIYQALIPLVEAIAKETEVRDELQDYPQMWVIVNNLEYLLELFKEDLEQTLQE